MARTPSRTRRGRRTARTEFPPRDVPFDDLREYVRRGQRNRQARHRVVLDVARPAASMEAAYGRWVEVADRGAGWARLTMDVDDFVWPLNIAVNLSAEFRVIGPPELADRVAAAAAAFSAAVGSG